jgi:hypothetical protein
VNEPRSWEDWEDEETREAMCLSEIYQEIIAAEGILEPPSQSAKERAYVVSKHIADLKVRMGKLVKLESRMAELEAQVAKLEKRDGPYR